MLNKIKAGNQEKKLVFINSEFHYLSKEIGNNDWIEFNYWGIVMTPPVDLKLNVSYKEFWRHWQLLSKFVLSINQGYVCPVCNNELRYNRSQELHHALITKADVMGLKLSKRVFIHHTFNTIELCKSCHEKINRTKSLEVLSNLYTYHRLLSWYNDSQKYFKIPIRNLEAFNVKSDT